MMTKPSLLCSAALGIVCAVSAGGLAEAAAKKHVRRHVEAAATAEEVRALRAEVQALEAKLDAQSRAQADTTAQVQAAEAKASAAQMQAQAAQTRLDTSIQTIPTEVQTAVAAIPQPKTDKLYYKGISVTLGGFLEAATIYRSHNEESDIASSFANIPLPNNKVGRTDELRESARQSRLSFLAEGNANPDTHLAMYGEFDFQGAAQTANSNESNSYNPRIRHLYMTADWKDEGIHLLAGQNWSLATMNTQGITPRNELTPPQIDAQYVPGFVWTRQPQLRLTKDFDKKLWLAVSLENPATTFFTVGTGPGVGALPSSLVYNGPAGSGFNSANTLSLNHVPDVIGKVAFEPTFGDRTVHLEAFGIYRDFYDRYGGQNHDKSGGGVGGGIVLPLVPHRLDLQFSGLYGKGVGRYGSAQLPDVTFRPDGSIAPITEIMMLAGATFHATPKLDIYAFAGEERDTKRDFQDGAGLNYGYGNPLYDNLGCLSDTATDVCNGNTRSVEQATAGFWDKAYQGSFGRLQFGVQYSYTRRQTFNGVGGSVSGDENMIFTSIRYYPF